MRFVYEYRTSDNELHEGSICARNRDAAFSVLRAQGIRPCRLHEAPGFANKLFGKGKRWIAIGGLLLLVIVSLLLLWVKDRRLNQYEDAHNSPLPRHQLYGDPALISELEHHNFASIFSTEAERILAWFAQPGVVHTFTDPNWAKKLEQGLIPSLSVEIQLSEKDPREIDELKRIVIGMKQEARRYLANGIGTPERYVRRLRERQLRELQIYRRAVEDLKNEQDPLKRERINSSLRAIGLRTVPHSDIELGAE